MGRLLVVIAENERCGTTLATGGLFADGDYEATEEEGWKEEFLRLEKWL